MTTRRLHIAAIVGAATICLATLAWLLSTPSAPGPAPPTAPIAAGAPITPEITSIQGDDTFRLHVFTVPLAGARLRVIDLGMSRDLAGTLAKTTASLVINGGFFDERERPEGLVISEGKELSARSDTLGGGVLTVAGDHATLHAAEGFTPAKDVTFAVQARPRLVVDDRTNIVEDTGQRAERTALCVRDEGRTLEVVIARGENPGAGPTLALLADMLQSRGCRAALNLDGGPSTGAAWREPEGARELPARGPLRHAIAIWIAPD